MQPTSASAGIEDIKSGTGNSSTHNLNCAGFSVIEVCIVAMIAFVVASAALINIGAVMPGIKANRAMYQAVNQLRHGRQMAIAQRRSIVLSFPAADTIQLLRDEVNVDTTLLSSTQLGDGCQFIKFAEVTSDTPDQFGYSSAVYFQGANTLIFQSDGSLVDQNGTPRNGTLLIGLPGHPEVARAVTILGTTGLVQSYRWNGTSWIN